MLQEASRAPMALASGDVTAALVHVLRPARFSEGAAKVEGQDFGSCHRVAHHTKPEGRSS